MKILRRTIHPEVRVLDEKQGLVEYVASDETIDSMFEVISASGWRFDDFKKNSPFVDSHNYNSIDCLLGKVTDFEVRGNRLIETVKWAIDVPTNVLAVKGFQMTVGGYLKAVSVGFVPTRYANSYGDSKAWASALAAVGLKSDAQVKRIYLEQQQKELSACVIGANPNALARAFQDGVLDQKSLENFIDRRPELEREIETVIGKSRRSYSLAGGDSPQTETEKNMQRKKIIALIDEFKQFAPETKSTFEDAEHARETGDVRMVTVAAQKMFQAMAAERRINCGDPVEKYLNGNPEAREFWDALPRMICGGIRLDHPGYKAVKALAPGDNALGSGLLPIPVSQDVYDLLLIYGAFRDLGVVVIPSGKTKLAKMTAFPNAIFITPGSQGQNTIPEDTQLTGESLTVASNTIAALIVASREVLADEKADLSAVLLRALVQGLASRTDYAVFQGNGVDDENNGAQTGIFVSADVATSAAANGNTTVAALQREDFVRVIAKVATGALQRPCRWFISPAFLPSLMLLRDPGAHGYLLKGPTETEGEWRLCDFPVTWAAQAPSTDGAGNKVAAFGEPHSYLIALREQFEITNSEKGLEFASNNRKICAIARGRCDLREKTGLATLTLAPQ